MAWLAGPCRSSRQASSSARLVVFGTHGRESPVRRPLRVAWLRKELLGRRGGRWRGHGGAGRVGGDGLRRQRGTGRSGSGPPQLCANGRPGCLAQQETRRRS